MKHGPLMNVMKDNYNCYPCTLGGRIDRFAVRVLERRAPVACTVANHGIEALVGKTGDMEWNRPRDALLNGLVGFVVGFGIARLRGRDDSLSVALVVGAVVAVFDWLTYEKPQVMKSTES